MQPFIRKYTPKNLSEIIGQDKAVEQIFNYVTSSKKTRGKPLMLYGPPGTGKTASVHAAAKEQGFEIIEVNASDLRNKDQLQSTVGAAMGQQSLFAKSKVILIDEIDGIAGRRDRGGLAEITSLIETSPFPVILTLNNPYEHKFSKLRRRCNLVEFPHVSYQDIVKIFKNICKHEKIGYDEEALTALARRVGGDARAAINDLQSASKRGPKITSDSVELAGEREQVETLQSALVKVFKTKNPNIALSAFEHVQEDLNEISLWIDENMPKEYKKPQDLYNAYESIAKANVYQGRIKRRQHWRFLAYISNFLTAGVALAKEEKYKEFVQYMPTMRLLRIWQANMKNSKKKAIAQKIAPELHTSTKRVMQEMLPYYQAACQRNKHFAKDLQDHFELNGDEMKWMTAK